MSDTAATKKGFDLAQAIIDLHKFDPQTGEVKDFVEDNDKAEALREVIGQISGKISPALLAKLAGAVEALRFHAPKVEDNEPVPADNEGEPMPADNEEGIKSAMDECGLDSDDPDAVKAFKAGMDFAKAEDTDCDTAKDENPDAKDSDTKDEDPAEDEDTDAKDSDAEDEEGAKDEEAKDEDEPKGASDHKARKRMAMDAATVKKQAVEHMRSLYKACDTVKPLVGELKVHAFDSASDVYAHALKKSGINPADYPRSAWAGMVSVLLRKAPNGKPMAVDAKPMSFEGPFAYLKNIV